jgi:hypothetical protein
MWRFCFAEEKSHSKPSVPEVQLKGADAACLCGPLRPLFVLCGQCLFTAKYRKEMRAQTGNLHQHPT